MDEIQDVKNREKCVSSFPVSLDCDICITGSNAKLLSGEFAAYLGGRYVAFVIYPFLFGEFIELYRSITPPMRPSRVDFPEQVVLGEIRRLTKYAGLYEDDFLKEVIGHSRQAEETERRLKEKELKSLLARDDELDGLFERIYEDNVSGKLSDDRFAKMSRRYEEEQKELSEKIKKLRSEIEKQSSRATSTDMFVSIVRKYTRARKLTPRMLNELVEKIEIYNAEKIDGEWVQRLRIHYNCVGEMNIPNEPALPIPAVTVNTRKGVFVSYTTDDRPAV